MSPSQRLGNIVHRVLRALLEGDRLLLGSAWEDAFDGLWSAEVILQQAASVAAHEARSVPQAWPHYEEKRLRGRRLADSLRSLLSPLSGATILPEIELVGYGGRLRGIADLVVRSDDLHAVIDFKSGEIASEDGLGIRDSYRRQLLIYAALEASTAGSWPSVALFPLKGAPFWLEVDIGEAQSLAAEALELLDRYNQRAPGVQPARPSVGVCNRCDYAWACDDFWVNIPEDTRGVSGVVTAVFTAATGKATLALSSDGQDLRLESIAPDFHADLERIRVGCFVRAVGVEAIDTGRWKMQPWGQLHAWEDSAGGRLGR